MKRVICTVICIVALSGCSKLTGEFIVNSAVTEGPIPTPAQKGEEPFPPIDLNTFCIPQDLQNSPCTRTAYQRALKAEGSETSEDARLARNQLMLAVLRRSEEVCNFHKGAIMATSAATGFTTGFMSAALSTLSSAFTPATTKTALSASAAITDAAGTGLRANIYQNVLAPAVVTEITNQREARLKQILARKVEDISSFPITEALYEVERYHELCSFYVGIAALAKDRAPKARTKEDIQNEIDKLIAQRAPLVARLDAKPVTTEQKSIDEEYKILSSRIQNLMRLQEIVPSETVAPTSPESMGGDNPAQEALAAMRSFSASKAAVEAAFKAISGYLETFTKTTQLAKKHAKENVDSEYVKKVAALWPAKPGEGLDQRKKKVVEVISGINTYADEEKSTQMTHALNTVKTLKDKLEHISKKKPEGSVPHSPEDVTKEALNATVKAQGFIKGSGDEALNSAKAREYMVIVKAQASNAAQWAQMAQAALDIAKGIVDGLPSSSDLLIELPPGSNESSTPAPAPTEDVQQQPLNSEPTDP